MNLKGKRVLVVGAGLSGCAAVKLLHRERAHVTFTDERSAREIGSSLKNLPRAVTRWLGRKKFLVDFFDLIVTSPGVYQTHPSLARARQKNIPIWPELELGWRFVTPHRTIAVTGTNGKTTTTSMIAWILKSARRPVVVGGNIGTPLSALVKKI